MPIVANTMICATHGYNVSPCWINYTLSGVINSTNPNPIALITTNLPWWGLGLWLATYVAIFIIYSRSGGREKFLAMGIGGFIATVAYIQVGIMGVGSAEIGVFALSLLILIVSAVAYALIKDSGE